MTNRRGPDQSMMTGGFQEKSTLLVNLLLVGISPENIYALYNLNIPHAMFLSLFDLKFPSFLSLFLSFLRSFFRSFVLSFFNSY